GLLAAWLTALALAAIAAAVLLMGGTEALQATLRGVIGQVLDRIYGSELASRDQAAATLAMVMPGVVAVSWMITVVLNAAVAQGVLACFGANWRPSPDLARLGLPIWLPIALGLAAAAILIDGDARYLGINALIALSASFC